MEHRDIKRILVLELWNIGDVVLTLPFLQQLRVIFPNASVVLAGGHHARELLASSGLVDEFIETDLTWQRPSRRLNPLAYPWREIWRLGRRLRRQKLDVAFQCRPHVREYVILALSGARRRVGVSMTGWDRLLTDRIDVNPFREQKKESWLRLLEPFGGRRAPASRRLEPEESAEQWAGRFLATRGVTTEDLLIGVHPGASVPSKRWPIERFGEIVNKLVGRRGVRVVVFVDPAGYGSVLEARDGRILVREGLPEMVALLERCDLLVCNDSGPMHIAGALDVPCVAVFSSGIEQMFEPLGGGHQVVTPAAGESGQRANDVTQVPTTRVLDAIEQAIG